MDSILHLLLARHSDSFQRYNMRLRKLNITRLTITKNIVRNPSCLRIHHHVLKSLQSRTLNLASPSVVDSVQTQNTVTCAQEMHYVSMFKHHFLELDTPSTMCRFSILYLNLKYRLFWVYTLLILTLSL